MRGRITGLTVILLLLFALVLGQAVFVQVHEAAGLNASLQNPRVALAARLYARGEILSRNGLVLARSIPTKSADYPWRRSYPLGSLVSDVVGYSSLKYGTGGIEYEYNNYLVNHVQPAHSISQLIAPSRSSDTVELTLSIPLQQIAARALAGRDGAVVAIDPRDGSVLAMYSNPTYNPAPLTSTSYRIQQAAWKRVNKPNGNGFAPIGNLATQQTFPPGSTFKVVTTSAILRYDSALQYVSWGPASCLSLVPYGSPLCLENSGGSKCGGTIVQMLPESCDPGYAYLGIQLGAKKLFTEANQFGYDSTPPIDLTEVTKSYFPPVNDYINQIPQLGYSAIGQWNVRATALQGALVAAGIANGGKIMSPHFMREIINAQGQVVTKWKNSVWRHPLGKNEAAQVNALMQAVVQYGTASGVGFLYQDDVAAKTGTAQTSATAVNFLTDDWMIAFAPASDPLVAVAAVVPNETDYDWGATIAGPIVKCVIEGALAIDSGQPPVNTYTTCPS